MKILTIKGTDIEELLSMPECIEQMKLALRYQSEGSIVQPTRMPMWLTAEKNSLLGIMPGGIHNNQMKICGVKVITIFFNNHNSHQGAILLFEAEKGEMIAMLDGATITAIRTAACSGLATSLLMHKGCHEHVVCAILGSGTQAHTHLEAIKSVCGSALKRVQVWSHTFANAQKFVDEQTRRNEYIEFFSCSTVQQAVEGADIINTVTASAVPILEKSWIKPGAHINAVGACTPARREVSSECVAHASVYVDSRQSVNVEAGDLLIPVKEGAIGSVDAHVKGEIGELLMGTASGRKSEEEVTLFKSLGLAVEDLVASYYVYQKATTMGKGTWIEL